MILALLLVLITAPDTQQVEWASPAQGEAFSYGPWPQCASGGWGCVSGETRIVDVSRGVLSIRALTEAYQAPVVLAWTGADFVPARASVPFLKGIATLYHVQTASGLVIRVTDEHRFLTPAGWRSLRRLGAGGVGARLRVSGLGLPASTSDISRSRWHVDGPDCWQTAIGFLADYPVGHRCDDGRLPRGEGCSALSWWDRITNIEAVGEHAFYDLHVPVWNNYLAEGFVNHNSGKTHAYCLKGLWLSDTFPKNRGVIARRVAKELRATTMATFFKLCPPAAYDPARGGRRNDQDGYLKLAGSGSEILFLHFEDPNVQGIIRGLELNWFLIDQAEEDPEHMETIWDMLLGRLGRWDVAEVPQRVLDEWGRPWPYINPRTKKPSPPPYAMLACNPDTELHWIYRRFHPESPDHRTAQLPELGANDQPTGRLLSYADLGYRLFEIHTADNQFLPVANKQALLAHDDAFVQRNYYGRWGYAEGTIHTVAAESLVPGSPELLDWIRATCTLHRVLDHGESSPTCCLWMAVDRNGNLIFYREYYLPNALISTHRANITALSAFERYEFNLADPSILHKTIQKYNHITESHARFSIADEYADTVTLPKDTALFWSAADNNELGTRNRINEYLRVDPERVHPFTQTKGSPRLFFLTANASYPQGCVHSLAQTRAQRRVKVGTELGKAIFSDERDEVITDHAYDPIRYAVASRAPIFVEQGPSKVPGTFFGEQQRLARWQQRQARVRR